METFGKIWDGSETPYHEQMTKVYCYWLFGHNQIKKT